MVPQLLSVIRNTAFKLIRHEYEREKWNLPEHVVFSLH